MDENNIIEFDPAAMGGMEEEFDGIITMTGEDGEEVNFLFLDLIEYEGFLSTSIFSIPLYIPSP